MRRGWTYWRDWAQANLGYTDDEAEEYARMRVAEDAGGLYPPTAAPPSQLTVDDSWPEDGY